MKNNIPKIISGIAATIFLIFVAFVLLPSFWFWVSFEIFAALFVVIGCGGEWWLHHHPAGRRKQEKDEHHNLESRFIGAVVIGVTMELFALGHTIREGAKLENEVALANERTAYVESNNIVLAQKLEKIPNGRVLTDEDINRIHKIVELAPKSKIRILTAQTEGESDVLAANISRAFTGSALHVETHRVRLAGVLAVFISKTPDEHLLVAVNELFKILGQKPKIVLGKWLMTDNHSEDVNSDLTISIGQNVIGEYPDIEELHKQIREMFPNAFSQQR